MVAKLEEEVWACEVTAGGLVPIVVDAAVSDTPETDAMVGYDPSWGGKIPSAFARRLERERNAAYASLREMIALNEMIGCPGPEISKSARAILPENKES